KLLIYGKIKIFSVELGCFLFDAGTFPKAFTKNRRKKKRPDGATGGALSATKDTATTEMMSLNCAGVAIISQFFCWYDKNQKTHNLIFR
ncbi:hypothetical protein, partial [Shigella sonnei]|uniref:hypothetical protein n=3 Tax=Shigella sonnei TaxID=624 RepID=UPI003395E0B8